MTSPSPSDDPWAPVTDGEQADPLAPGEQAQDPVEDPFAPLHEPATPDLALPLQREDELDDPWGDAPPISGDELVARPAPRLDFPALSIPLLLAEPAPTPLPWRSTARLRSPIQASVLCEADTRQADTQLRVTAWEWVPGDEPRLRFRLNDDGADVLCAATSADEPRIPCQVELGGQDIELRVLLTVDRTGRGLILGRDLLAGRFLVDPEAEDWPD